MDGRLDHHPVDIKAIVYYSRRVRFNTQSCTPERGPTTGVRILYHSACRKVSLHRCH